MAASLHELQAKRVFECRLEPDRALGTLDEAHEFLSERGMLTLMPSSTLPSLFGACHEEPYMADKPGFAQWPKTKYPWAFELRRRPGVHALKIHRGKELYLSDETMALAAPLCRAELAQAEAGEYGDDAQLLVSHLAAAGPSALEELKVELGFDSRVLRRIRAPLERVGAIRSRGLVVPTEGGGHRHTGELLRFDQLYDGPERDQGVGGLLVAGVLAAVLAPEREARGWFSWPVSAQLVAELVESGRLYRPDPGSLASPASDL